MAAKRSMSEFVSEIHGQKSSGLLSIALRGANTLLKLFFRDGELYHLTCWNVKGSDCLAQVRGSDFAEYFFMPDMVLTVSDEKLPPLSDILRLCSAALGAVEVSPHSGKGDTQPAPSANGGRLAAIEGLTQALIRQIGPAGSKVIARTIEQKWQASTPPTRQELQQLVDLLKNEIENPDDQKAFIAEAGSVIA